MIRRSKVVMFLALAGIVNLGLIAIGLYFSFSGSTLWGCLFLGCAVVRGLADGVGSIVMKQNEKIAAVAFSRAEEIQKTSRELSQVLDGNNALIALAMEQNDQDTVQKLAIQGYNAQVIYRARMLILADATLNTLRQYR